MLGRSLNCTGYTGTLTFASTTAVLSLGDGTAGLSNVALTLVSGMTLTLTGIGVINFISTSATQQTITTGGKTMPRQNVGATGSSYILSDANTSSTILAHVDGTFNTGNQTCSWTGFSDATTNTRTLTLGSSAIALTGTGVTVFDTGTSSANITPLTVTANTAIVTFTGAGSGFRSSGKNWNGMSVVANGSGDFLITSSANTMTFGNFTRNGTAVKTDSFTIQQPVACTTLTLNANSLTNRLLVDGPFGSAKTITATSLVATNVIDFQDITGAGAATWTTGASGATSFGDCGGNSGITFTTPATQTHTSSAGGNWSDATKWTSRVPLPQDNVIVNVNTTGTLSADMPRLGANVDFTGFTGTASYTPTVNTIYGNWTQGSGMTNTGAQTLTFSGRGSQTITSNGKAFSQGMTITTIGTATYTLQDALSSAGTFNLLTGGFITGSFNVTTLTLNSFNSAIARVLTLGTTNWSITQTTTLAVVNLQTSNLTLSASSSTITISTASTNARTFTGGGLTFGMLAYTVAGSTGGLIITAANSFNDIQFSDVTNARTLTLPVSTITTIRATHGLTGVLGTSGKLMSVIASGAGGTPATIDFPNGYGGGSDWLSVKDITATTNTWYAGANSTNVSGNTNVTFTAPPSGGTPRSSNLLLMGV